MQSSQVRMYTIMLGKRVGLTVMYIFNVILESVQGKCNGQSGDSFCTQDGTEGHATQPVTSAITIRPLAQTV